MKRLPRLTADAILYGVSTANALRLAWAYATADAGGVILSLPGAFGLMLGAMVSIGTAFVAGRLTAKVGRTRRTLVWTLFVILLIAEVVILAPITASDMPAGIRATLGWASWPWAVTLALVPSLVLAGVAVANGGLVDGTAHEPKKPAAAKSEPAPEPVKPAFACSCGRSFGSQAALNAHQRSHNKKGE